MHQYVVKLIDDLGLADAVAAQDIPAITARLAATDKWRQLCELANAAYCSESKWLRQLAAAEKIRRKPPTPAPKTSKDPYWSLWGRLKVRAVKDDRIEAACMDDDVLDAVATELATEWYDDRPTLRLPVRGVAIESDGKSIWLAGTAHAKPIKSDSHAVNTLRKLDTNDFYFAEWGGKSSTFVDMEF